MPAPARRKDDVIQIRTSGEAKAILDKAATLGGQKLSEFMLECARREAESPSSTSEPSSSTRNHTHDFSRYSMHRPSRPPRSVQDCGGRRRGMDEGGAAAASCSRAACTDA